MSPFYPALRLQYSCLCTRGVMLAKGLSWGVSTSLSWAALHRAAGLRLMSTAAGTNVNLTEVAEAAGLAPSTVSTELLSRLNDPTLVHTAGYIDGKWTSAADKTKTFEVGGLRRYSVHLGSSAHAREAGAAGQSALAGAPLMAGVFSPLLCARGRLTAETALCGCTRRDGPSAADALDACRCETQPTGKCLLPCL